MGKTSIEWTEHTWNPTRGCSRVSEGCRNCYAELIAARFCDKALYSTWEEGQKLERPAGPFHLFAHRTKAGPRWTGKVELIPSMLDIPLRRRKPTVWFVNSMSDLFHEALPDHAIAQVFSVMESCRSRHTFQILTKRADRMWAWVTDWKRKIDYMRDRGTDPGYDERYKHVWLGVSVENQETADARVPLLLQTPAAVRFVSYEPALGPVDFENWLPHSACFHDKAECAATGGNGGWIDQIIVGGESGPGARPFDIAWARQTIAQCRAAGVACFVKQLGAWPYVGWHASTMPPLRLRQRGVKLPPFLDLKDRKGGDMSDWPEDLRVRELPVPR